MMCPYRRFIRLALVAQPNRENSRTRACEKEKGITKENERVGETERNVAWHINLNMHKKNIFRICCTEANHIYPSLLTLHSQSKATFFRCVMWKRNQRWLIWSICDGIEICLWNQFFRIMKIRNHGQRPWREGQLETADREDSDLYNCFIGLRNSTEQLNSHPSFGCRVYKISLLFTAYIVPKSESKFPTTNVLVIFIITQNDDVDFFSRMCGKQKHQEN